jgi:MFS family permease
VYIQARPSPTSILLNIGHAMDHWILVVFAYSWGVIAGIWGVEWTELTPFNYGALFMFGAGSIVSGRLGDHWGRWIMMVIFFAGMGASSLVIALCTNKWQIGAALTLMGAFASIYHPVGIPMLVQKARNFGFTIGLNGLAGNMGIALAAGFSVYIAQRFGWQMAFILPGVICLVCAVAFVVLVPREEEAPAKPVEQGGGSDGHGCCFVFFSPLVKGAIMPNLTDTASHAIFLLLKRDCHGSQATQARSSAYRQTIRGHVPP